jgi:hypothetical protein
LVSFSPLAQKHLSALLKGSSRNAALTVPLTFHSDSPGQLEITSKRLTATFAVKPLSVTPTTLRLGGSWVPLTLSAAAGLHAEGGAVDLTAKVQPRSLNDGSPEPPSGPPGAGLKLTTSTIAATAMRLEPVSGTPTGTVLALASARALIETSADTELVLELRGDAGGAPGPVLAGPEVKQLQKGFSDWLEFELAKPLPVSSGGAPVWLALRLNRGEVYWFTDAQQTNSVRFSTDGGQSWAPPQVPLASSGGPLAQLFHLLEDPLPPPVVAVRHADQMLSADFTAACERTSEREFAASAVGLPASLLTLLSQQAGAGRVATQVQVFSRSVVELTLDRATIAYDPFAAGAATS